MDIKHVFKAWTYLLMYFWVRPGKSRVQSLLDLVFSSFCHPVDLKAEECLNKCLNEVLKSANEFWSLASDSPEIFYKSRLLWGKGRCFLFVWVLVKGALNRI